MIKTEEKQFLLPGPGRENASATNLDSTSRGKALILLRYVLQFFSSGRLLKALSFIHGLRDPRKAGFWAAVFTIALVVTDLVYAVLRLFTVVLCPIDDDIDWFLCAGVNLKTMNGSNFLINKMRMNTNGFVLLMTVLADVLSHFVLFFCFLKLAEGENTIKPVREACALHNRSFWLQNNFILVLLGSIMISFVLVDKAMLMAAYLWDVIIIIPVWRSIVDCCLFGMLMMALKDCVKTCETKLKTLQSGELNDAIAAHQHLCARVFSTSDTLKPWFIINWLTTILWGVFCIGNISTRPLPWFSSYENILIMCIALFLFLYPCYSAASVTSKCRQILIDMNMTTVDDWPPGHPLKQRSQLLQFIQYAEYSQCGYRVGKTVFGSSYVWISTLVALLIGAVKFLYSN